MRDALAMTHQQRNGTVCVTFKMMTQLPAISKLKWKCVTHGTLQPCPRHNPSYHISNEVKESACVTNKEIFLATSLAGTVCNTFSHAAVTISAMK